LSINGVGGGGGATGNVGTGGPSSTLGGRTSGAGGNGGASTAGATGGPGAVGRNKALTIRENSVVTVTLPLGAGQFSGSNPAGFRGGF
jgi:hypothetical protein